MPVMACPQATCVSAQKEAKTHLQRDRLSPVFSASDGWRAAHTRTRDGHVQWEAGVGEDLQWSARQRPGSGSLLQAEGQGQAGEVGFRGMAGSTARWGDTEGLGTAGKQRGRGLSGGRGLSLGGASAGAGPQPAPGFCARRVG